MTAKRGYKQKFFGLHVDGSIKERLLFMESIQETNCEIRVVCQDKNPRELNKK